MEHETLQEPNLYLGLLAIRNEFLNLSELKHCLDVRRKLYAKSKQVMELGDVLVQQRYLTPQDLEYLHMIVAAEPSADPVVLTDIEAEFDQHVAELKEGADFGPYRIEDELGRGGMGIVFRAVNRDRDEQECALKILIGGKDATVRDIERFKKEATVMAPLLHPGIVKIYEVGRQKGLDYIAMEYVDGVSLKELVGDKPLPDDVALRVTRSAAEAVAFMHSHGIIHRDIKPENIMVRQDGSAVLMDFGLAGWDKIEVLAGRGSIGTPMYQPPEQADVGGPFGPISEASDVYGLGATLYYLLTARHPFLGKSVKEVRDKIKGAPPDPPRQANAKLHPATEALCLRCLKKRQSERFGNPKELVEKIDQVLGLVSEGGADRSKTQTLRRIAAATRRRSDAGKVKQRTSGRTPGSPAKSPPAAGKAPARAPRPGRASRTTGRNPTVKSGTGPVRAPQARRNPAGTGSGGKPPVHLLIIGGVALLLLLILAIVIFSGGPDSRAQGPGAGQTPENR